jgi:hypothetical protein
MFKFEIVFYELKFFKHSTSESSHFSIQFMIRWIFKKFQFLERVIFYFFNNKYESDKI